MGPCQIFALENGFLNFIHLRLFVLFLKNLLKFFFFSMTYLQKTSLSFHRSEGQFFKLSGLGNVFSILFFRILLQIKNVRCRVILRHEEMCLLKLGAPGIGPQVNLVLWVKPVE
jgi:hypothetical protein